MWRCDWFSAARFGVSVCGVATGSRLHGSGLVYVALRLVLGCTVRGYCMWRCDWFSAPRFGVSVCGVATGSRPHG